MIKTILTATDGSTHARKAIELAADIADKYDAKLVIMHVLGQGDVPDELVHLAEVEHVVNLPPKDNSLPRAVVLRNDGARSRENHQIHAFIGEKILQESENMARNKGLKNIHRITADGDPARCILATADAEQADMIVMGSRGMGDLKGLLIGSVSHKVNHLAECTCVCVK